MNQVGANKGGKAPRKFTHKLAHLRLEDARPFTEFIQEVLHLKNESEIEGALRGNKQAAATVVRNCINRGRIWMVPFSVPANGGPAYREAPIIVGMLDKLTTNSVAVESTICKDSRGNRLNMSIFEYATDVTGLDLRKRNLPALIATGEEFPDVTLFEFPVEMLRIATKDSVRPVSHGLPTYPTGDAVKALFGRKRPYPESASAHMSGSNTPRASGSGQVGRSGEPIKRMSYAAAYAGQAERYPSLGRSRTPSRAIRSPGGAAVGAPRTEPEVIDIDVDRVELLEQQLEKVRSYYVDEVESLNGKYAAERQKNANLLKQLSEVNRKAWDWSHVSKETSVKLEAAERDAEMYKRRCSIGEGEVKMLKDRISQLEKELEGARAATTSSIGSGQEAHSTATAPGTPSEDSEEGQYEYYESEENANDYDTLVNNQGPTGPRTPPGKPRSPTEEDLLEGVEGRTYENIDEDDVLKEGSEGSATPHPGTTPTLIMPPDAPPHSATYQIDATGLANGYVGSFESNAGTSTSSEAATAGSSPSQAKATTSRAGLS